MGVVSTADLVQEDFQSITLGEPYASLLGSPAPGFTGMIHGEQGAGKSTFALGLAYHLLPHALVHDGSVLYVSAEEGHGATSAGKARRLGVDHDRLLISDAQSVEEIKAQIEENDALYVVIDSGNRVDPTSQNLLDLLEWCEDRGVGLLLVQRQTKEGQYRGDSGLAYDPEVEIEAYKDEDGDERARTHKNRHHRAPQDVSIPMQPGQIGEPVGFETARRENPNCENWDQKDAKTQKQCKAMFANLRSSGSYDPEEVEGTEVGETETPQGEAQKAGSGDDGEAGGEEAGEAGGEKVDLDETSDRMGAIQDTLKEFLN